MNPVPTLDIDKRLFAGLPQLMPTRCRLERRVVWGLLQHLEARRYHVTAVDDGETRTKVTSAKEAMELVFNLDECRLLFACVPFRRGHTVVVILGNGIDCIADYSICEADGWDAAMAAFNEEEFA